MEVKLLWRRPNAPSVALRGDLRILRLAEFVRYTEQLSAGHQSAANELTRIKLPRLNLLRANPVCTLLAGHQNEANEITRIKLPRLNANPQSYQIDV